MAVVAAVDAASAAFWQRTARVADAINSLKLGPGAYLEGAPTPKLSKQA